jgi:hypothetical protein
VSTSLIEDILPLTPWQEGLLYHALAARYGADAYAGQISADLTGPLDAGRLRAACQALLRRHANLRALFRFGKQGQPLQVIPRQVDLPWKGADLSEVPAGQQQARIRELAVDELAHEFDMARPPLLRFMLVRLAPGRHTFIVTQHHILADGWSVPVLLRELLALYQSGGDESVLPPVSPYRDYLKWLAQRDRAGAEAAWGEALSGLAEPTLLASPGPGRTTRAGEQVVKELPAELSAGLRQLARTRGLTLNTLAQGAWAVTLSALTGQHDVIFGVTVSGRPSDLPGVESMVGLFTNTIPLRIRLAPGESAIGMLTRLQDEQARLLDHQHLGLAGIQRLTGLAELFDTLMVFASYRLPEAAVRLGADQEDLRFQRAANQEDTHYPLSLLVIPGPPFTVRCSYKPDLFDRAAAEEILARLLVILEQIVADPAVAVRRLAAFLPRPAGPGAG